MLRLVDPTNVADAASAGEGTCVERISPMEGEAIALALFPSASDQQFESLSLRPTRRYAIAEVTRGLFEPLRDRAQARAASKAQPFSFPISAVLAFSLPGWIFSALSP
jgi:hypothetical protein